MHRIIDEAASDEVSRMPTLLSYEDDAALPDDGHRYELIEGGRVATPSPGPRHQWAVPELAVGLREHVKRHDLGRVVISPVDVILSESNALQPDIV